MSSYGLGPWPGAVVGVNGKGDGITDDTEAVQEGIWKAWQWASQLGERVYLRSSPGAQHLVSYSQAGADPVHAANACLLVPSHVCLDGLNLITPDPGTSQSAWHVVITEAFDNSEDIGVTNCTVNGSFPAQFDGETAHTGLMFTNTSNLFLQNNYTLNFGSGGCNIFPTIDISLIRVLDNVFDLSNGGAFKLTQQGTSAINVSDVQVKGNLFRNNLGVPVYEAAELVFLGSPSTNPGTVSDVIFAGNILHPTGHGLILQGLNGFTVSNNVIDNSMFSTNVAGISTEGTATVENGTVQGNTLYGLQHPFIHAIGWKNVLVVNNSCTLSTTGTADFWTDGTTSDLAIIDNTLSPTAATNPNGTRIWQNEPGNAGDVRLVVRGNKGWNDVPLSLMNATNSKPQWPGQSKGGNMSAQPTLTSGTATTNNSGYDATVYVAGTVSSVAINGVTTGLTTGSYDVPANHTITVTGSAATWEWLWR